jgi:hypothetical protein
MCYYTADFEFTHVISLTYKQAPTINKTYCKQENETATVRFVSLRQKINSTIVRTVYNATVQRFHFFPMIVSKCLDAI